jgi:hypothetical protein
MKIKKKFIVAGSLLAVTLMASMSHNDSSYSSQDHSKMVKDSSSPKENSKILKKITTRNNRDTLGVTTAPASPVLQKPTGYVSIDALLMNVYYDQNSANTISQVGITEVGKVKSEPYEFGWNWGVQASAGFRVSPDAWDLNFDFTYLNATRSKNLATSATNSRIVSNLGLFNSFFSAEFTFGQLNQKNSFTYYDGDINLSREFFVSKRLSLMPYAGAKGVYIQQRFKLNGQEVDTNYSISSSLNNNFWGVGPQIGSGLRFGFTKHFSLDFLVDGALLWGYVHNNQQLTSPQSALDSINLKSNRYQVVPNANILADIVYDINFANDKANFAIRFGYETRYYFSNFVSNALFTQQSSATSIQGFNLGVKFTY